MNAHDIFVYGTLRPDCGNDRLWQGCADAHHDGAVYVVGFALVNQGGMFPYMVPAATGQVVGALIVPHEGRYDDVLGRMDQLEGYVPGSRHNHYERTLVPVFTAGWVSYVWTYIAADWVAGERDLPDVPVNGDGFYDWRLASRRYINHHERINP